MKQIVFFSVLFVSLCQGIGIKYKENKMIDIDSVIIKPINFIPKKMNKICLLKKIDTLFKMIELSRIISPYQLPQEDNFHSVEMNISKKEKLELSNRLLMKKHISTKGNFEWRNLISSKYLLIKSKKYNIYIMYPMEPEYMIISGKSFNKIKEGSSILVRGLKNWIDMKECMQF